MTPTNTNNTQSVPAASTTSTPSGSPVIPNGRPSTPGTPRRTAGKKKDVAAEKEKAPPPDPASVLEGIQSRIAALENEGQVEEEEERNIAKQARDAARELSTAAREQNDPLSVMESKYLDLFQEMKRLEREHTKERQKLLKDKDLAKGNEKKANSTRTKLESLARELQKENKRLKDEMRRLEESVEAARADLESIRSEMERKAHLPPPSHTASSRVPSTASTSTSSSAGAEIRVKVTSKGRADLWFKVRKSSTLARLFSVYSERMAPPTPAAAAPAAPAPAADAAGEDADGEESADEPELEKREPPPPTGFLFLNAGRFISPVQTPDMLGMEEGDEIIATEELDLTSAPYEDDLTHSEVQTLKSINTTRSVLQSEFKRDPTPSDWTTEQLRVVSKLRRLCASSGASAREAMDHVSQDMLGPNNFDIDALLASFSETQTRLNKRFDIVVRQRLKEVLRQYELRERHFEAVLRSKELEVLLAKARSEEAEGLAEGMAEESARFRKSLENEERYHNSLFEKLIACLQEPTGERAQRIFTYLRDELEKRGSGKKRGVS